MCFSLEVLLATSNDLILSSMSDILELSLFFLFDEKEIILPLVTTFPASQRVQADIPGRSLFSRYTDHSLLK